MDYHIDLILVKFIFLILCAQCVSQMIKILFLLISMLIVDYRELSVRLGRVYLIQSALWGLGIETIFFKFKVRLF